jgi:hypothetical protein
MPTTEEQLQQQQYHSERHPPTTEITLEPCWGDSRNCDTSFGSLRSLVSKDGVSLLFDDDQDFEESPKTNGLPQVLRISMTDPSSHFHHHQSSQRSISTEMAIIASSSPEIKALSDQPIAPSYPHEINFDLFQDQPAKKGDVDSKSTTNDGSLHHPNYESPVATKTFERDMVNHHRPLRGATPSGQMEREDAFMDDADELALYMEQSTIGDSRPTRLLLGQKENVMPRFDFGAKTPEASNTTHSHGGEFTFKSAMRSTEPRRHRSLNSVGKRPSFHRRVSFDSLPSPAEITSTPQQRPLHRPSLQHITCNFERSKSFELGTKSPLAMDFKF